MCTIKLTHRGFLFCIRRSKIILRQQQRCFCTFGASVFRTSSCSILACTRIAFEVRHICTMMVCSLTQCTFAHFRGTKRCAICRKISLLFRITPRTCHTKKSAVREQNVSIDVTKPAFQTKLKNKSKKTNRKKKKWRNEYDFLLPPSSLPSELHTADIYDTPVKPLLQLIGVFFPLSNGPAPS